MTSKKSSKHGGGGLKRRVQSPVRYKCDRQNVDSMYDREKDRLAQIDNDDLRGGEARCQNSPREKEEGWEEALTQ